MANTSGRDPAEKALGIAKAGIGAAITSAVGGLSASATAAQVAVTMVLESGAQEFAHRLLSARERERVDRVLELTRDHIVEKLRLGYEPRADGFFQGEPGHRSAADEITEGVLLTAQRQYQEKKLAYIAYLHANIAFSDITADTANFLVRLADQLSYRQLCLLALFANSGRFPLRQGGYHDALTQSQELWPIIGDIKDLDDRGLVSAGNAVLGLTDVNPGQTRVQGPGGLLYNHMNLSRIPVDDLTALAAALS